MANFHTTWQLFCKHKNSLRLQANNSLSCSWNNSYFKRIYETTSLWDIAVTEIVPAGHVCKRMWPAQQPNFVGCMQISVTFFNHKLRRSRTRTKPHKPDQRPCQDHYSVRRSEARATRQPIFFFTSQYVDQSPLPIFRHHQISLVSEMCQKTLSQRMSQEMPQLMSGSVPDLTAPLPVFPASVPCQTSTATMRAQHPAFPARLTAILCSQPQSSVASVPSRTSTAILRRQARNTVKKNVRRDGRNICQNVGKMWEGMWRDMPKRMSDKMLGRMSEECDFFAPCC